MYIRQGSPRANGCVESFNGKLHDELLNRELFLGAPETRYEWMLDYNRRRPHSALDWKTPTAFARHSTTRRRRVLTRRSGLRPSLRLSTRTNTTRFSHNNRYKKRGRSHQVPRKDDELLG